MASSSPRPNPDVVAENVPTPRCHTCLDPELDEFVRECLDALVEKGKSNIYHVAEVASRWRGGNPSPGRIYSHVKHHEPDLYDEIQRIKRGGSP